MDLSPELRVEIYKELMVVGRIFFTPNTYELLGHQYAADCRSTPAPSLAILRVCKAVHDEAEDVYLGHNIFVLPLEWNMMPPFPCPSPARFSRYRVLFSESALTKLKHISLAMSVHSFELFPSLMVGSDWDEDHVGLIRWMLRND